MEKASTPIAVSTHESKQDAADDVGMSNTVSASVPLKRRQPMTKQAATQKTGTVAVRRQEQLGVSSSEEHKTFHKTSRWDIREQRPDAALDVLGAGLREHGLPTTTGSARHADRSIRKRMSAS